MLTLGGFLRQVTAQYAGQPAISYKAAAGATTAVWTYRQLWDQSSRVVRRLQDLGITPGDRVAICGPNSAWWVAAYFGCLRAGAILVPLDVHSSDDFVARAVQQTEPKLALRSNTVTAPWPFPIPVLMLEDLETQLDPPGDGPDPDITPEAIAELVYTSGATGDPKGVILSHANITATVGAMNPLVPNYPHFRTLSLLPLSHMMEQTVDLLLALNRGASIYYLGSVQPAALMEALQEHKPTTMVLVPQALDMFMNMIEREVARQGKQKEWHRLQQLAEHLPLKARRMLFHTAYDRLGGQIEFLSSGGAPLSVELIHKWELIGIPIMQGYGMTEAATALTITSMEDRSPHHVGRPVAGVEIRLAPDGEILARGPNMMQGYWQNATATEHAFEDGWYRTGDLGRMDADGHLVYLGRKKDMIVLANGLNVYAQDVEQALRAVAGVKDAVVVGLPTERGAQIHAVLLLAEDAPDPATIVRQANATLAPHQRIVGTTVWPEEDFPRTHTLKVRKPVVLAAVLAQHAPRATEPAPTPEPVGAPA
jgi:long-chain acyl-CoA synthetase